MWGFGGSAWVGPDMGFGWVTGRVLRTGMGPNLLLKTMHGVLTALFFRFSIFAKTRRAFGPTACQILNTSFFVSKYEVLRREDRSAHRYLLGASLEPPRSHLARPHSLGFQKYQQKCVLLFQRPIMQLPSRSRACQNQSLACQT